MQDTQRILTKDPKHRETAEFHEDDMTHYTPLVIASAAAARTVRRILLRAGAGRFKSILILGSARYEDEFGPYQRFIAGIALQNNGPL